MAPEDADMARSATKIQATFRGKDARRKLPPKNQTEFVKMLAANTVVEDELSNKLKVSTFPWKRKTGPRFAKIKGVSVFKEKDPSYGAPIPRGIVPSKEERQHI